MRYQKIVLGTDGSESARAAHDVAVSLATAFRAEIVIVHGADRVEEGRALLAETEATLTDAGVRVSTVLREELPADAIIEVADQLDADLIILGSRGLSRARRILLGSVSMRVAHHAPCDVLIVRRGCDAKTSYRSMLVATDGSATADRCARKGYGLAEKLAADMTLLFVGHPKTGEIVLKDTHEALETGVETSFRIEQGDAADRILDVAEQEGLDLIVIGNKGLTGGVRFLLGSVPQKVAQYAECDVLIARTTTQALGDLKAGDAGIVRVEGGKVAVYVDPGGEVHALSAKCTHLGCTVGWNASAKTWDCPCHGSRFGIDGAVVNGPASKPLPKTFV